MAKAMKQTSQAMKHMSAQMNLPELSKIMEDFKKESETLGIQEELMSDTIDEALADEEDEEQEEVIINQVLDEIGIDLNGMLASAPSGQIGAGQAVAAAAPAADSLESRLENLKK
jgi:charged multivesicular body protein 2A